MKCRHSSILNSYHLSFCILVFLFTNILNAQTNLFFESIKLPGLTTPVTRAVAQDDQGIIYIGTNDGFFQFNGYAFTKFSTSGAGKFACPIQNVRNLNYDGKNIWLGGAEGLAKLDLQKKEFTLLDLAFNEELKQRKQVKFIKKLSDTEIVVGTYRSFNIININSNAVEHIEMPHDFKEGDYAFTISYYKDINGNIVIGTVKSGFYILKNGEKIPTPLQSNELKKLSLLSIYEMQPYKENEILVGTDQGLFLLNIKSLECEQIFLSETKNEVDEPSIRRIVSTEKSNEILIATYGGGMFQYFPDQKKSIQYTFNERWFDGIADNYVNDLIKGKNNIYWIATENSGVQMLNGFYTRYAYVLLPQFSESGGSISVTDVKKIGEDIFMTTSTGLVQYSKDNTFEFYTSEFYGDNYLQNIQMLNDDYCVFQVYGIGVGTYHYKTHKLGFLKPPGAGITGTEPVFDWMSYTDKTGDFYFVDFDGNYFKCNYQLNIIDTLFTPEDVKLSLPLVIPENENELIIISGSRLFSYHLISKKLIPLIADKNGNTLPPISFQEDVLVHQDGNIFLASDEGLFIYNKQKNELKHFTEENGLPSLNCFSLTENAEGDIMIALGNGQAKFIESDQSFIFYPFPYLFAFAPTPFFDGENNFYLGADNSFIKIPHDELQSYEAKPILQIHSIKADHHIVEFLSGMKELRLKHTDFPLEIEYALIDYLNPDHNRIMYQLEGWDDRWINSDKVNFSALYSKLSSGDYTFKIKGFNAAGIEAESIEIPIHVMPPFWQTNWFIALLILSILLIPYFIYRYRLNQLKKIQTIRNNIAYDLHDEVGSSLSSIKMLSEIAVMQENNKDILYKISTNAKESAEKMQDIIWMINPKNDSTENMLLRMKKFLEEMCAPKGIQFEFNNATSLTKLDMQKRKNILLVYKEAVNNAVKYSEAEKISSTISEENHKIIMKIIDNGKGFDEKLIIPGNGLDSMRMRTEELKGKFEILSEKNKGTQILVSIPL